MKAVGEGLVLMNQRVAIPGLVNFVSGFCCCLPRLPQLAWRILATWGPLFSLAPYEGCANNSLKQIQRMILIAVVSSRNAYAYDHTLGSE